MTLRAVGSPSRLSRLSGPGYAHNPGDRSRTGPAEATTGSVRRASTGKETQEPWPHAGPVGSLEQQS